MLVDGILLAWDAGSQVRRAREATERGLDLSDGRAGPYMYTVPFRQSRCNVAAAKVSNSNIIHPQSQQQLTTMSMEKPDPYCIVGYRIAVISGTLYGTANSVDSHPKLFHCFGFITLFPVHTQYSTVSARNEAS